MSRRRETPAIGAHAPAEDQAERDQAERDRTEPIAPPAEHDRELLDYLIERAWQELLRHLPSEPKNENTTERRAA